MLCLNAPAGSERRRKSWDVAARCRQREVHGSSILPRDRVGPDLCVFRTVNGQRDHREEVDVQVEISVEVLDTRRPFQFNSSRNVMARIGVEGVGVRLASFDLASKVLDG